jgi:SdrD B-like domain/HYR domain/Secretion system C-terminal sorting domain
LGDFVFRDSNGNGIQDAGEVGVAGVTVKLYDSANNVIATTTTDANGKYLFDNLTAGNYTVEFVKTTLPSGLGFSPQGATTGDKDSDANVTTGKTATITLTEGQTNNDIDAGVTAPCDKDVTPPVLSACPYDVLIKTRGTAATVSWTAPTATDECGTPVVTSTNASGSQFPVGKTVVTYTATDAKGNKTTCSFTVTVVKIITCDVDTQAPIFYDCPTDISLTTTGTGAVALWDHPSVGDNCGIPSVVFNYSPGQNFPVGVTTVIYTAKDAKGNTSYCMFKVTVIKKTTLSTGPVTQSMNTLNSVNAASESVSSSTSTPITGATSARKAAVEEVKVGDEVNVYPNPTSSDFSIELSAELMKANNSVEVSVFNMTGTTQFTHTAAGTERVSVKVPVENMTNGTYFVNVALDNGRMIIKKVQILK